MALVMGITLPAGMEIIYNKTLRMYDISVLCNIGKNPRFFPRSKKMTLKEITYLFSIAYDWSLLGEPAKTAWQDAGLIIGQHGYNLYVQDKSYRLKNGIGGNATPSIFHQFTVGHISIGAPATEANVAQYNQTRVNFPASFELCYHTNLISSGPSPSCELVFTWTRYYQGQNIENIETIPISLVSAWTKGTQSITQKSGIRGKWRVELKAVDVTGDIWFDNLCVTYSGEVKNPDPYCEDVITWYKKISGVQDFTLETVYPVGGAL